MWGKWEPPRLLPELHLVQGPQLSSGINNEHTHIIMSCRFARDDDGTGSGVHLLYCLAKRSAPPYECLTVLVVHAYRSGTMRSGVRLPRTSALTVPSA